MSHFNLRYFLETLGDKRGSDMFVLQIGAMDGKTFDPIYEYITRFNWGGLLVEPIAEQFEKLKQTYVDRDNINFANTAIAENQGTTIMYRLPAELLAKEDTPKWGVGTSSFYKDRNALTFDEVKDHIIETQVPCTTLQALLSQHNVERIDLLQIDTEGYDYHVLKQFDFERYKPFVVHMEIVNLPKSEQGACKQILDKHGYLHAKAGYDLLAVSPEFFKLYH